MNGTEELIRALPAPDAVALMAHPLLQKFLLLATFTLHVVPMNFLLGGSFFAVALKVQKIFRLGDHENAGRLYRDIVTVMPTFLSFAITLGVAPLLFLQALYGPLFYTSTILMAPFWLLVPGAILLSYYSLYLLSWTREKFGGPLRLLVLAGAAAGFIYAAFMFSSNNSLMQSPGAFHAIYERTFYGVYVFADLNMALRFLHVLFGSLFVSSIILFALAWLRREIDPGYAGYVSARARPLFYLSFAAQLAIGVAMLLAQKAAVFDALMGRDAGRTFLFWAGVLLACLSFAAGYAGRNSIHKNGAVALSISLAAFLSLAGMVMTRDFIRDAEMKQAFSCMKNACEWNYFVVGLFFAVFACGLAAVSYMLRLPARSEEAEKPGAV